MQRSTNSAFTFLQNELRLEDELDYRRYIRMNEDSFEKLLNLVSPFFKRNDTNMRLSITPVEKLTTVLRFLATGESYRSTEFQSKISLSYLSQEIPKACSIIYERLKVEYLKFPTQKIEWKAIAEKYAMRWQFPLCLGALDGKHIAFRASKKHGALYYNYKGFNSIVLLALADADSKFIYIDIGCNGRISDSGVLSRSDLRKVINNGSNHFPDDTTIGNNKKLPYVLIGDNIFPLEKHILKPYPYNSTERTKRIFNVRLSHARQTVEHAFGILSNRFRVLQTPIHLEPRKVKEIVKATCALHNFLTVNSNGYMEQNIIMQNTSENEERRIHVNRFSNVALHVRDRYAEYFSSEGAVPWQEMYI